MWVICKCENGESRGVTTSYFFVIKKLCKISDFIGTAWITPLVIFTLKMLFDWNRNGIRRWVIRRHYANNFNRQKWQFTDSNFFVVCFSGLLVCFFLPEIMQNWLPPSTNWIVTERENIHICDDQQNVMCTQKMWYTWVIVPSRKR